MKYLKLFEEHINEIGDAGAKPYQWKYESGARLEDNRVTSFTFLTNDDIEYMVDCGIYVTKTNFGGFNTELVISFGTFDRETGEIDQIIETNKSDIFKIMSTIVNIVKHVLEEKKDKKITTIKFEGSKTKGDNDRRRNKLYVAYVKKQFKNAEIYADGDKITVEL